MYMVMSNLGFGINPIISGLIYDFVDNNKPG